MKSDQATFGAPPRLQNRLAGFLIIFGDLVALLGALALSLQLRFDGIPLSQVYHMYVKAHSTSTLLSLGFYIALFASFRLYRYAWRFASLETLWGVLCANSVGLLGLIGLQTLLDGSTLPRSVLIIFWMASVALVGGVRIILRLASLGRSYGSTAVRILQRDLKPRRVVIMGAGPTGVRVLNALREDHETPYEVIGFLDDDQQKQGTYIRDARVLGPLNHVYCLLTERAVDGVFIALPQASGADIREYVMACRKRKIPVKVIPAIQDVLNKQSSPRIEDISVEDLLRRPPANIDVARIGGYLTGKRVLVTGAGGSIGSELCRQIIALKPSAMVLLGHGENSIYSIQQELLRIAPEFSDRLYTVIASVANKKRIDQVFRSHRPQVVFHAAAHKHVPLMELNVPEAIQNNVIGTSHVAEACGQYEVERMVLISSDKAVYPSSVMGATKWLCEEVVRAMAGVYKDTTYVTVRFGNVLGSRGSVVPMFYEQIRRGGPVTVTHPEMTRYFMSIPEAVQLVLQAGAVGKSGELYLLDMGDPVKIADLASDIIRLCGYEPDVDIQLSFTGIRAGEKLHEHLVMDEEIQEPASCKGLSIVHRPKPAVGMNGLDLLARLEHAVDRGSEAEMIDILNEVVPAPAGVRKKSLFEMLDQSAG